MNRKKENKRKIERGSNKQKCKELKQTVTVGLKTQYHSDITEPDGDEIDNKFKITKVCIMRQPKELLGEKIK